MMSLIETSEDNLVKRNKGKIEAGLVEQKFFLRGVVEATHEEIYKEINEMDEAYERGDFIELVRTIPLEC